jgi:DNA-binding response OmpR family regulator
MSEPRILLVENDWGSLNLMTEAFRHLGAEVRNVAEGTRAAELVNRERFDGIFLSLDVPAINGFDLPRWIRNSSYNRSSTIVAIVARNDHQAMHLAFASGVTCYLEKPLDNNKLNRLFATVRSSLHEHRRKFYRVPLSVGVTCSDRGGQLQGTTRNLSQGGLQVELDRLECGESKLFSFRLPSSSRTINATGSVVWVKEKKQGIKFESLRADQERAIADYIARLNPESAPIK